jgi:branched-chain amino acid transport system permease protein
MGLILAALVGLLMARYRGVFFAMLNLAVSMILYAVLLKLYHVTGGSDGIGVGVATLAGVQVRAGSLGYYYFTLVIAGIMTYVVHRFMTSPVGSFLKALGENEIRIEYTGESVWRVMYVTYLLTGLLGGVSGVLAAFSIGHVVPEDSYWYMSGEFVFVALLGGFEGLAGPLMGSIAFEFIQTYTSKFMPYAWQMVLGGIMLLVILFRPGGLLEIYESLAHWLRPKKEEVVT